LIINLLLSHYNLITRALSITTVSASDGLRFLLMVWLNWCRPLAQKCRWIVTAFTEWTKSLASENCFVSS